MPSIEIPTKPEDYYTNTYMYIAYNCIMNVISRVEDGSLNEKDYDGIYQLYMQLLATDATSEQSRLNNITYLIQTECDNLLNKSASKQRENEDALHTIERVSENNYDAAGFSNEGHNEQRESISVNLNMFPEECRAAILSLLNSQE